jgi:Uri superfamily endonuclease
MHSSLFTLFGSPAPGGSYILVIRVAAPLEVVFGGFMKGVALPVPAGDYLYTGSALGGKHRHNPLAARLIRHASRSGEKKPHAIRESIINLFPGYGNKGKNPGAMPAKKLRWHIDFLLDLPEAEIVHIVIIRSPSRLEGKLSGLLEALDETSGLAPRLGAQDTRKSTHLLRLSNREKVLGILNESIPAMLKERNWNEN